MRLGRRLPIRLAAPVLLVLACGAAPARAQSLLCTPITAVPVTINAAGVYCLDRDLVTSVFDSAAIYINADNVVVDLNGFALRRSPVDMAHTTSVGIYATSRNHVTVRNGTIRNFAVGIYLQHPFVPSPPFDQGHLVEGVSADGNSNMGIWVDGAGSIVRNNRVLGTGGTVLVQGSSNNTGIRVVGPRAQVVGNDVSETSGGANGPGHGLYVHGAGSVVEGNRVGNVSITNVPVTGITLVATDNLVVGNRLAVLQNGITFAAGSSGKYRDNLTTGVAAPYQGGTNAGNNQ